MGLRWDKGAKGQGLKGSRCLGLKGVLGLKGFKGKRVVTFQGSSWGIHWLIEKREKGELICKERGRGGAGGMRGRGTIKQSSNQSINQHAAIRVKEQ